MRRTLLMIAAVALLLTQCRKPAVELPTAGPANENMVSMTVTVGHGGKTDINGTTGAIKWSKGDKLYVGNGSKYIGCLTLVGDGGSATGTFSGTVTADAGTYTFGFYYLGSGDYTTSLESEPTSVDIPFGTQTGLIGDLDDCHIGYGTAKGKVEGTSVILASTDPVTMTSKVAIAYFEFKENGTSDYTGAIKLSGANIYNKMTVKFSGAESDMFTGKDKSGISLASTPSSDKYVMLVPTGIGEETLNFGGDATGTTKFYKGIEANKFYCLGAGEPIEVAVKPVEFTVGMDGDTPRKVKFAPGNLQATWNGSGYTWAFAENQYDYVGDAAGNTTIDNQSVGAKVDLFGWTAANKYTDGIKQYGINTSKTSSDYSSAADDVCCDWGSLIGAGWRTLSNAEWLYLIGESNPGRSASLREGSAVTFGESGPTVKGLIIMPDGWGGALTATTDYTTWQALEASGAVFLPAAGLRSGSNVVNAGLNGYSWSSTPYELGGAYHMVFSSGDVYKSIGSRYGGYSVRLVR